MSAVTAEREWVPRLQEEEDLKRLLLLDIVKQPPAVTAVVGFGGFGKTALVNAVCRDEAIRDKYKDGELRIVLGENPKDSTAVVLDQIEYLSGTRRTYATLETAVQYLTSLLAEKAVLIILDDVWNLNDAEPFLLGGAHCHHVMITRRSTAVPPDADQVFVGAMKKSEASALLAPATTDLNVATRARFTRLANRLSHWPLLLRLVRGKLQEHLRARYTIVQALDLVEDALSAKGLEAFDERQPRSREQAVHLTMDVCIGPLEEEERTRYRELGCFPIGTDVPISSVERLWKATGNLTPQEVAALCLRLFELSLLEAFDAYRGVLRLHDVLSQYLENQLATTGDGTAAHAALLDSHKLARWADLGDEDPLWDSLGHHLIRAGRSTEWISTLSDLAFLAKKVWLRKTSATERDLLSGQGREGQPARHLETLRRHIALGAHVLNQCDSYEEVVSTLLSRLAFEPSIEEEMTRAMSGGLPRPLLVAAAPLADLPSAQLLRTLSGHTGRVYGCAIAADASLIASASEDGTVRIWNATDGASVAVLRGHTARVFGCSLSSDRARIASCSEDRVLNIWSIAEPMLLQSCVGHEGGIWSCAFFDGDRYLVSAGEDAVLRIWKADTGELETILTGHDAQVSGCAALDSDRVVSASHDGTLAVWDWRSNRMISRLKGHAAAVWSCSVSLSSNVIVSSSVDKTLRAWDIDTGKELQRFEGHSGPVWGCAITADGSRLISASEDTTLRVWDVRSGATLHTLSGHSRYVWNCAVDFSGAIVVSASLDKTIRLWNIMK